MRKMLWWGAAGLLASAGAVYTAVQYSGGDSATVVCRRGVSCERGSTLGAGLGALVSTFDHGGKSVTDLDDLCPSHSCKLTAEPAAEECPEVPVIPASAEASEPIQIQMTELVPPQDPSFNAAGDPTYPYPQSGLATGGAAEESEASVASPPEPQVCAPDNDVVMPKVEDADNGEAETMPYIDEDSDKDDCAIPFSAWLFWLKKDAKKIGSTTEQSELLPGAAPAPMVPVQIPVPQVFEGTPIVPVQPMQPVQPPLVAVPPGYPTPEAVPPMDVTGPPNCQEDPHYHHQYPGCPYTGGCPYQGGHGYPTMKDFAEPKIEKAKKKKKKKEIKATPTSMLKKLSESLLEDLKNSQVPKRCGVDTMECRPTDARLPGTDNNQPF